MISTLFSKMSTLSKGYPSKVIRLSLANRLHACYASGTHDLYSERS
jgi:hypothetical protein